jgi:hypothetical protein
MDRRQIRWLTIFAVLVLPLASMADDEYPTNLELESVVRAAVDSMVVLPPSYGASDLVIEAGGGDTAWLLDSILKEKLLGLGWTIRSDGQTSTADSVTGEGYVLKIQVIDLGLRYGRGGRKYLLVGKMVERIARVSLYYELIDSASDRVVMSSNVRSEKRDVVPASRLAVLSDSNYGFASPELGKSQWDKILEGGLVVAIIGVLIYLFYSNKTASN